MYNPLLRRSLIICSLGQLLPPLKVYLPLITIYKEVGAFNNWALLTLFFLRYWHVYVSRIKDVKIYLNPDKFIHIYVLIWLLAKSHKISIFCFLDTNKLRVNDTCQKLTNWLEIRNVTHPITYFVGRANKLLSLYIHRDTLILHHKCIFVYHIQWYIDYYLMNDYIV